MAIDTNQLRVKVHLQTHGKIDYKFTVNGQPVIDQAEFIFNLFDDLEFRCELNPKSPDGAVEIVRITINEKEILPLYLHLGNKPTHWLNYRGEWHYYITAPFYSWYHTVNGQGWIA